MCVCDLAQAFNMTASLAISHQLRILKQNKLVKQQKRCKLIFYSLADDSCKKHNVHRDGNILKKIMADNILNSKIPREIGKSNDFSGIFTSEVTHI